MKDSFFYLTTTLPYVNADPHIGFALEIVAGDVLTRFQKTVLKKNVVFNTGTDEHGQKIYQKALENNQNPQEYVDHYAARFGALKELLNLDYTHFIRTTNPDHKAAAQHFWQLCDHNGYIYKKNYQTKYCVGCELEKTDSELVDGLCPLHPTTPLEIREEENYFFRFSAFQQPLLDYYQAHPDFVQPAGKMKEITAFVQGGLQDFSISRLKEKMPWGVPVPGDENHVMYVWFDALVNYISTLGWPQNTETFQKYWPGIQLAGKDNLRQQAAMWQAMLLAARLPLSEKILINGFIGVNGQKMSKSLGNVIAPAEMVTRYGTEATRYLLMNLGPFGTDMDVSWEKLDTAYTALLSHGLGNVCSRIAKLCEKNISENTVSLDVSSLETRAPEYMAALRRFDITAALQHIQKLQENLDGFLAEKQPWKLSQKEATPILIQAVEDIQLLGWLLTPFMPTTAQTITQHFSQPHITALSPLFPRLPQPSSS